MDKEKFLSLMSSEKSYTKYVGCEIAAGLDIVRKHLPARGVDGAGHDIVYSVDVDELIEAGITEYYVNHLSHLNWMVEDGEYLCHFV